jgi:heme-degrading monooxygenase HmoA
MYTVVRRYEGIKSIDEVIRRATSEFAPLLAKQPGFQGYYAVKGGEDVLVTITVFETEAAANDSTKAAASWVSENMAEFAPSPPQVTTGETTAYAP